MISLAQATVEKIVIHKINVVANNEEEGTKKECFISKNEIQFLDEETQEILKSYFSLALKSPDLYRFIDNHNLVASECEQLFEKKTSVYDFSVKVLEKLTDVVADKDINANEVYVAYFTNCEVDDQFVDAVGIFTSEQKETFLKLLQNENEINFQTDEGIGLKKLNKGCIIFNITEDNSYIIKAQDNTKGDDVYWIDNFLEAKAIENEYFNTESFFKICKDFNDEVLAPNNTVANEDRIKFLQNSLNYFQTNQTFDENQFNETTIGNPEVIQAFNNFKQGYRNKYEVEIPASFDIDETAVKKSKKYLRSVIKLDKNFHIYVHSRPEYLERGYDAEKGISFYKVFFEVES
ncbi:MAG: hypothetical protein J6W37_09925 [Bacteroidales bacterium]|nr:hypothetical protein [Bacteroidales bacterium]